MPLIQHIDEPDRRHCFREGPGALPNLRVYFYRDSQTSPKSEQRTDVILLILHRLFLATA
jgi:hypothetical protein